MNSQPGPQQGALQSPAHDLASPASSFRHLHQPSHDPTTRTLHSPVPATSAFATSSYAPTSVAGPAHSHSTYLAQPSPDAYSLYSHHPSQQASWLPYASANTSSATFSAPESPDAMAAPHTMRPSMPNLYQTPQSASPASAHSQDSSARPLYGAPHQTGLYFNTNYSLASHSPYMQHHSHQQQPHQHPSLGSQSLPVSYGQPSALQPNPIHSQTNESPRSLAQLPLHRGSTQLNSHVGATGHGASGAPAANQGRHGSTGGTTSSAPGPIPATTPLVITEGDDGIQRIIFEYSRDRIKVPYTIKCNVETIDHNELTRDFKESNCVYPRACNFNDHSQYKGNRFDYETQCNKVGWALAALNPELRGKRGLIQRAVDSWRNSAADVKLRSRRVRRLAKNHKRSQHGTMGHGMPINRPTSISSLGHSQDAMSLHAQTQHNHHLSQNTRGDHNSAGDDDDERDGGHSPYARAHAFSAGHGGTPTSPLATMRTSSPPSNYELNPLQLSSGRQGGESAVSRALANRNYNYDEQTLFAELRNITPRKSMTVKDYEHGSKRDLKLNIMLEGGDTILPPGWRDKYSVYPRSHKPVIAILPPPTSLMSMDGPRSPSIISDASDDDAAAAAAGFTLDATRRETAKPRTKPVTLKFFDDTTTEITIPRIKRTRREREKILNELSHRMSWHRHQDFCDVGRATQPARMAFLQRCMDAYRRDIRSKFEKAPGGAARAPAHFEYRPGKARWAAREAVGVGGGADDEGEVDEGDGEGV